jgi:hypothetical protein
MTTTKSLLMVGALALASLGVASAKSYEITLGAPAKLGSNQLKAGQYRVKLDGTQATLTDEQTLKSYTVPVTVEHAGQKFDQTTIQTRSKDGVDQVFQITLGGSDTKLSVTD